MWQKHARFLSLIRSHHVEKRGVEAIPGLFRFVELVFQLSFFLRIHGLLVRLLAIKKGGVLSLVCTRMTTAHVQFAYTHPCRDASDSAFHTTPAML